MKNKVFYLISLAVFFTLYFLFNSQDIIASLSRANSDSPFAVMFQYGSAWILAITVSAIVYIGLSALGREMGPKRIEMKTEFTVNAPVSKIIKKDPEFNADSFLMSVSFLGKKLNTAWTENRMGPVRNLVSAGLQNRFRIQLELMKMNGIQNIMSEWVMNSVSIAAVETDASYETVHVEIHAWAKDLNISRKLTPEKRAEMLLEKAQEDYFEIWSFVRKRGAVTKYGNGILSGNCPNCGADIRNLGELNQCRHCKSVINSGEYGWVLSEITQKEEWNPNQKAKTAVPDNIFKYNDTVNRQIIEDRTSYLFWRWMECLAKGNQKPLSRDASDEMLKNFQPSKKYIGDAAVGAVELLSVSEKTGRYLAKIKILWSASFSEGAVSQHRRNIFTITIPMGLRKKSGLSENSCESCGAPLPETDALKCSYCGSSLPLIVNDWILELVEKEKI
ncbi:MAG TPA: hypothetical protein PKA14_10460 [Leptospiraceae bacterium]|nr:hypothetical protein [Leptospiraceae bacterium]